MAHPSTSHEPGGLLFLGAVTDITETRRALEALRRIQQRLRDVIDTIPTMARTARPGDSVEFVSRLSRPWLEYTRLPWMTGWRTVTHPEDLDRTAKEWQAALATGEPHGCEVRTRTARGFYRWCWRRAVPLRDDLGIVKWYGTSTDIGRPQTR